MLVEAEHSPKRGVDSPHVGVPKTAGELPKPGRTGFSNSDSGGYNSGWGNSGGGYNSGFGNSGSMSSGGYNTGTGQSGFFGS